ncbi:hypothetical protein [Membranihabitans maritimus]|uniref:hypothetical protein n=1 Tax=Membranihabitans maritimus TaxID=2904244 RepID=UPI001F2C7874|nr:hypothetical protein [Membranihabitans maritimus]
MILNNRAIEYHSMALLNGRKPINLMAGLLCYNLAEEGKLLSIPTMIVFLFPPNKIPFNGIYAIYRHPNTL